MWMLASILGNTKHLFASSKCLVEVGSIPITCTMDITAPVATYIQYLTALVIDRPLAPEVESERVEELTDIWTSLTEAEQELVNQLMMEIPLAPADLGLVDDINNRRVPKE